MKKRNLIFGVAAVLVVGLAAKSIGWYRWSKLSSAEKAGTITEKMASHLKLNEEQKGKIYALNLDKMEKFDAARKEGNCRRGEWKQFREEWKNEVREVLTPEQRQKFWR